MTPTDLITRLADALDNLDTAENRTYCHVDDAKASIKFHKRIVKKVRAEARAYLEREKDHG